MNRVAPVTIQKIKATAVGEPQPDLLAVEEPMEIRLGFGEATDRQQRSLSVTMRSPGHDFELALGFLYTEGLIKRGNRYTASVTAPIWAGRTSSATSFGWSFSPTYRSSWVR